MVDEDEDEERRGGGGGHKVTTHRNNLLSSFQNSWNLQNPTAIMAAEVIPLHTVAITLTRKKKKNLISDTGRCQGYV